jgi:hypothetical protein
MKLHFRLWSALAVVALLAGCSGSGGREQNSVDVRSVHLVPDAEPLDVLINGEVKAAALPFQTASDYANFGFGDATLEVRSATTHEVLVPSSPASFGPNTRYTIVLHGRRAAITPLVLQDDSALVASGKFRARFISISAEAQFLDLYLTTDIANTAPTITGLGYASLSGYVELPAGNYPIVFATTGTKDVLFAAPAQVFADMKRYTIVATPSTGGALVNSLVLSGNGDPLFLKNGLSRLKAVNALPDSAPLNFKADGTVLLSNVPYTGSSDYVQLVSGSHNLQVERSSVPGSVIASLTATLDPARDYTMVSAGPATAPRVATLADDNSLPTTVNAARVRFANLRSDTGAVDATVDGTVRASGIAALAASTYSDLTAGTAHTLTFTAAGGGATLVTLPDVTVEAGGIYTIHLFGTAAAPTARVVRDR